ncbi:MAG: helix-turn-helix domain-containing protein [Bacteroidales bacterium]
MQMTDSFCLSKEEFILVGKSDLHPYTREMNKIPFAMVLFCEEGAAQVTLDFKEYTLTQHAQLIVMPGTAFRILHSSKNFRVSFIAFERDFLIEVILQVSHSLFDFLYNHPLYHYPIQKIGHFRRFFEGMEEIYADRANIYRKPIIYNVVQCFFMDCYDKIHRYIVNPIPSQTTRNEQLFHQFISLLHVHLPQEREVLFYANKMHISSRHLSNITLNFTNKTAKSLIDENIIVEIKVLLQSPNYPIKEIVNKLNFPDQSYLGKYFKKHTGLTLNEYRML